MPLLLPSDRVDCQVFEEKQVKGPYQLSPAFTVGTEGCWGVVIMAGIVLPIMCVCSHLSVLFVAQQGFCNSNVPPRCLRRYYAPGSDHGSYENALDAVVQIGNNNTLKAMVKQFPNFLCTATFTFYRFFCTGAPFPSTISLAFQLPTNSPLCTELSSMLRALFLFGALTFSSTTK